MSDEGNAPSPDATLGVFLIGIALASVYYGITFLQACFYFRSFPEDRRRMKALVAMVWFTVTLSHVFICHAAYYYLVKHQGNTYALMHTTWSLALPAGVNSMTGMMVQFFLARRVFILSGRNWVLTVLIWALALAQGCMGWSIAISSLLHPDGTEIKKYAELVPPTFAITAATDVVVTASLVYYLQIRKTGVQGTNGLVNRLICMTIKSGLISSSLALSACIIQLRCPESFVPIALCFILGKAYANTFLTSLNNRDTIRSESMASTDEDATGIYFAKSVFSTAANPLDGLEATDKGVDGWDDRRITFAAP
ncbi:uncharacterized protein SCHCODRAFT_02614306 [Schizophyllum commune H4-8]|nr:uncharacterized protein SCHCODRAFT_02614306 [Schizophyllum commune H4-8]KAI5896233.1 hypothetical protein SCHCODRAFT_02614306 [Schizophyllum commune H4-8]